LLTFRDATALDAQLISRMYAQSWRGAYRGLIAQNYLDRLPDDNWVTAVRTWVGSGRLMGKLLCLDDAPVGCAIYGRGRDATHADWGEIVAFYLLPEHTRKGYGSALFTCVMDELRQEGYTRFYLWCLAGNTAGDAFYRRHGFRPTTDHVFFPLGGQSVRDVRYVLVEA